MKKPISIFIEDKFHGERIEKILNKTFPGRIKNQWHKSLDKGDIRQSGTILKWGDRIKKGMEIQIENLPLHNDKWLPVPCEPYKNMLLESDNDFFCIDKKPGIPTLPKNYEDFPTCANYISFLFPNITKNAKPPRESGITNRLDNDTSGLILIGKNPDISGKLRKYFSNHKIEKTYWAIVEGNFPEIKWCYGHVISLPGSANFVDYVNGDSFKGKRAISLVKNIQYNNGYSLVEVNTRFGRRHQVRVQLSESGFPIIGDKIYKGKEFDELNGHFLWAKKIKFTLNKNQYEFNSIFLESEWMKLVKNLGFSSHFSQISTF
jgi:23S rRNA pseudouridine1911/1915/1917 synthase